MLKKLLTTTLALMLGLSVMLTTAYATPDSSSDEGELTTAADGGPQDEIITNEEAGSAEPDTTTPDDFGTRPKNHMLSSAWLEDASGVMTSELSVDQTYTLHIRCWVVGDKDATNARLGSYDSLLNGTYAPSSEDSFDGLFSYWVIADNIGADAQSLRIKSATTDTLKLRPVSGSGKIYLSEATEPVSVPDYAVFSHTMGTKLGTTNQDGNLPLDAECEFTMEFTTIYASARKTATTTSSPTTGTAAPTTATTANDGNVPTGTTTSTGTSTPTLYPHTATTSPKASDGDAAVQQTSLPAVFLCGMVLGAVALLSVRAVVYVCRTKYVIKKTAKRSSED